MKVSAAILAGGRGKRMGGVDKQAIPIDGVPLGARLAARLSQRFGDVLAVTQNPGVYEGSAARVVGDLLPGFGPLSGLHAALLSCEHEWLYLAACDMPCFSDDWADRLEELASASNPGDTAQAFLAGFGNHIEPFQALYSKKCAGRLSAFLGSASLDHGWKRPSIRDFLDGIPHRVIPEAEVRAISPDWSLFFNINRPVDLEAYRGGVCMDSCPPPDESAADGSNPNRSAAAILS